MGLHYRIITIDNSRFVQASVHNVVETLKLRLYLWVWLFSFLCKNWRASLIAICSIPVFIVGTMVCLYAFGFSLIL